MQYVYPPVRTSVLQLICSFVFVIGAQAAFPASDGTRLYAPCVVCHQPNARGSPDGRIPNLAGQKERYLARQIASFRSKARVSTAMRLVSAHSTFSNPLEVSSLADYLSALESNPKPVTGAGEHLRLGQEIYTHLCTGCHGHDGRGGPDDRVPRIAKQHYPYLRRQLDEVALLHRKLISREMTTVLRNMRPQEKDALADYISRLENSEALLDLNPRDTRETLPGPISH